MGNLGLVVLALDRAEEAEYIFRRAIAIHRELGNELLEGADQANLAAALCEQSRYLESVEQAEQALPLIVAAHGAREQLSCRCLLAISYAARDDLPSARSTLESVEDTEAEFRTAQERLLVFARAHVLLAEARAAGGALDDARLHVVQAIIDEYRTSGEHLYVSQAGLERVLACYPQVPEDLSESTS
jgi:hypothetical protein